MARVWVRFCFVHHVAHGTILLGEVLAHLHAVPLMRSAGMFILSFILAECGDNILHKLVLIVFHLLNSVAIQNLRILNISLDNWDLLFILSKSLSHL